MPKDSMAPALAPLAETANEQDYEALVAALSESARGRAFLAEHAKRARHGDTVVLLAAIERLEALMSAQASAAPAQTATAQAATAQAASATPAPAPTTDPLAALKALSEDERLALFT